MAAILFVKCFIILYSYSAFIKQVEKAVRLGKILIKWDYCLIVLYLILSLNFLIFQAGLMSFKDLNEMNDSAFFLVKTDVISNFKSEPFILF
jgi:hypothetical protein